MTSHRSRFLASLSQRLESDIARREADRDDSIPRAPLELTGPSRGHEPSPEEEIAGDEIAGAPARPAARIEPGQDPGFEVVAPLQRGRPPPIGAFVSREGERAPRVPASWSETGMPLRLRETIASVRRVSHEMHEPPLDDDSMRGPVPYEGHAGHDGYALDDAAAYREPPPDDPQALLENDATADDGQMSFGGAAYEQPPPHDELALLDEDAGFQHAQTQLDADGPYGAAPADDQLALLDDDAAHEERLPRDETAHEQLWLDDDEAGLEGAPGHGEAVHDRQALRRGATTRYGVHAAAFAVAVAFVALAGFGLGILSDGEEVGERLARDTGTAAPNQSARSSTGQAALSAEPEQRAELSELVTERVAPAPVAAVPGPAPAAPVSTGALPLPPPPKPALRQSAADEAASSDGQLAGAVDDAAAALLEAEGAGGPFEPLFAKLPAAPPAQTRVLVHYTASAVGAPATAMHLVRHLKAEGFAVEARPMDLPIPTNSIRYFFETDREQAEALRSSLEGQIRDGAGLSVMDFTSHQPRPRPGLIEIWLRA